MILELLSWMLLSGQAVCPPPLSGEGCLFSTVLEDVRIRGDRGTVPNLLLNERIYYQNGRDRERPVLHPPLLLRNLRAARVIEGTCTGEQCVTSPTRVLVSLGPIIRLPGGARIPMQPIPYHPPGSPPTGAASATSSRAADISIDVVVIHPCPEPAESTRCRVPDTRAYRYFLRKVADGQYEIVARHQVGAV
jgi:hypothetical protein